MTAGPDTPAPVRVRVGDTVRCGRAIAVDEAVDPSRVAEAVRSPDAGSGSWIAVDAPPPGPVHDHVGHVRPAMGLRTRTALAQAARSQGLESPCADDLAAARERLAGLDVEEGDIASHRRALAEATAETDRLRERVATVRGKLQAAREHGAEAPDAATDLGAAIRDLSEVETEGVAARQQLCQARENARQRRDRRERVRRLEDRVANLEREARAHLVEQVADRYTAAVTDVPGAGSVANPFDADSVTAALAVARLAALSAPIVLACDRFDSAAAASQWLDAPVVRV